MKSLLTIAVATALLSSTALAQEWTLENTLSVKQPLAVQKRWNPVSFAGESELDGAVCPR